MLKSLAEAREESEEAKIEKVQHMQEVEKLNEETQRLMAGSKKKEMITKKKLPSFGLKLETFRKILASKKRKTRI